MRKNLIVRFELVCCLKGFEWFFFLNPLKRFPLPLTPSISTIKKLLIIIVSWVHHLQIRRSNYRVDNFALLIDVRGNQTDRTKPKSQRLLVKLDKLKTIIGNLVSWFSENHFCIILFKLCMVFSVKLNKMFKCH
jgi:hypothetical protein